MLEVQFTSTITVTFVTKRDDQYIIRLHAPVFLAEYHRPYTWSPDGGADPIFYVDAEPDPRMGEVNIWTLRGAVEAASEHAWRTYVALTELGVGQIEATRVLPVNRMVHASVIASDEDLRNFIADNGSHPWKELRTISEGYERVLAESSTKESP